MMAPETRMLDRWPLLALLLKLLDRAPLRNCQLFKEFVIRRKCATSLMSGHLLETKVASTLELF